MPSDGGCSGLDVEFDHSAAMVGLGGEADGEEVEL